LLRINFGIFQLSPFSDLDTEIADLMLRWKSAKNAFVTIMTTYVGMLVLASDPLGLVTIVNMLKDRKVEIFSIIFVRCFHLI
jgi:hypothetical protein